MFHDRARIHVQAGRGGDGSLHFRREKHVPRGGPDGGDGGPGGDVVLVADPDLRDLSRFRRERRFRAADGEPGRGALKHGATGAAAALRVPVGTGSCSPTSLPRVRVSSSRAAVLPGAATSASRRRRAKCRGSRRRD